MWNLNWVVISYEKELRVELHMRQGISLNTISIIGLHMKNVADVLDNTE